MPRFILTAQQAGFSATRYLLYFDSLLVLPAMFAAMVFMAASFSLRLSRLGGLGQGDRALRAFGIWGLFLASTQHVGPAMTEAAQKFVASLDAGQRSKALMKYDDPARLDWHNIPKAERKGLQIKDMTPSSERCVMRC